METKAYKVEFDREEDGRWIADVPELPGVLAYGTDREDAFNRVRALALRVLADHLERGEMKSLPPIAFEAA